MKNNELLRKEPPVSEVIENLKTQPDEFAANVLDARVRSIEKAQKTAFIDLGLCLEEFERRNLWKWIIDPSGPGLTFTSMDRWLASAAPVSRSSGYAALKIIREARSAEVPVEQLRSVQRCNLEVWRQVPGKKKADPEIIEATQTLSEDKLIEKLEELAPEAHIEPKKKSMLRFDRSVSEVIKEAMEATCLLEEVESITKEEAIEIWARHFLDTNQARIELARQEKAKGASA